MLITISTPTFDLSGYVEIDADMDTGARRRRVNRVATLDGGAVFNDFGSTDADRTMTATWEPTDAEIESAVDRMASLYQRVIVSCRAGVFSAAIESYKPTPDTSTLTLLVSEKLSA